MKTKILAIVVAALLAVASPVSALANPVASSEKATTPNSSTAAVSAEDDSLSAIERGGDAEKATETNDPEAGVSVEANNPTPSEQNAGLDEEATPGSSDVAAQAEAETEPIATTPELKTASSSTTYKITKSVNGANYGSIMVIGDNATLYPKAGAKVRFRTTPKTGYTLTRISYTNDATGKTIALTRVKGTGKAGTNSEYEFTMPAGNVTLNANFDSNKRTVTSYWTADGSLQIVASSEGTKASKYPQVGKKVTLFAPAKAGYRLVRMSYTLKSTGKTIAIPKVKGTANYYAFTMPNEDVKIHADFSAGKYYYEVYDVETSANVYSGCVKPLFIKTNNPNPSTIRLTVDGKMPDSTYAFTYDDVVTLDNTNYDGGLYRVESGYFVSFGFSDPGNHVFEVAEKDPDNYWVSKTVSTWNVNVLDYYATRDRWWQDLINKYTTPNMTKTEKMRAVCNYLCSGAAGFKYSTVSNGKVVYLATTPGVYFESKRWNSYSSPAALYTLAQKIGFADDDIHNCYGDYPVGSPEWQSTHYYCKVRENGEWNKFYVCPPFSTGEIGGFDPINFSKTSSFHSWMKSS